MIQKPQRIWQRWTKPQIPYATRDEEHRAQLLASMLLLMLFLSILYTFAHLILLPAAYHPGILLPLFLTYGGTFIAYLMSRGKAIGWAPLVFTLSFTLGVLTMLIMAGQFAAIPLFFVIPTLVLSVCVDLVFNITLTLFNFLLLLGMLAWNSTIRLYILQGENFLLYLLIVSVILLFTWIRNVIERNRQEAMAESQLRLLTFFETANDWIFMLDAHGQFSFINEKMCAETGYAAETVLGQKPDAFLTEESAGLITAALTKIATGQTIEVFTAEINLQNGRHFWVEVRGRALYNAQGNLEQTMHIARDITRRMQIATAEQQQRQLAEAMSNTAAILNSTLALDEVLDHVLNTVHRVVPYDVANITLIRDGKTRVVRHQGYRPETVPIIENAEFTIAQTADLQQMVETGQPIAIADARTFPGWVWIKGLDWIRAVAGAPIIRAGECIGFLHVAQRTPETYTAVHAASLQAFANHVANAIHNARLYEAEQRRRRLAETLRQTTAVLNSTLSLDTVLNRILEQLSHAISFDTASLQKRDGHQLIIRAVKGFHNPKKLLGLAIPVGTDSPNSYVFATRGPVTFPDIPAQFTHFQEKADLYQSGNIRSWLAVPLMFDAEIIGLITLDRHEVRPFTVEEIEVATAFAQHAAIALHNANLYDQLARYNETLETAVARRTAELEQTTQQVSAILQNSPDAILLLDHNLRPRLFNPAYSNMFGYKSGDFCPNFPICLVISPDQSRFSKALQIVRKEKQPMRLDFTAQRQDGSQFDADIVLAPIQQPTSPPTLLCSIRDITALKEIERVKDDFVSNVSHELRTPIASLKLYHDLLTLNPAKSQDYIARLGREITRLSTIVESLLQLSRFDQERTKWEEDVINLNDLVSEYATDRKPLAASRDIHLNYQLTANLPRVMGDHHLLGQVLSILLTNALNYTPPGGKVQIKTGEQFQDQQRWVYFEVIDTGQGVLQDELPHVLKRFYRGFAGRTSGEPGTGLGLAIADEIVSRHQGKIEVQSMGKDQGAAFIVKLPAAPPIADSN